MHGSQTSSEVNHRLEWFVLVLLCGLIATPFYLASSPAGVVFAPLLAFDDVVTPTGFGITIGLIGVAALAVLFAVRFFQGRLAAPPAPALIALALIAWMTVAVVYGLTGSERATLTSALYVQTIIPLGVFVALLTLRVSDNAARTALLAIPIVGAVSIILIVGLLSARLSYMDDPMRAWRHTQEAFFGVKNIHPAVALVGLSIILAQFSAKDRAIPLPWLWVLFLIHAAFIVILWSRTALLMFGLLFGLWWLVQLHAGFIAKTIDWRRPVAMGIVMALAAAGSVAFGGMSMRTSEPPQASVSEVRVDKEPAEMPSTVKANTSPESDRTERNTEVVAGTKLLNRSDNRRVQLLRGGIERIVANPLFGDAFRPLPAGTVIIKVPVKSHKLYPSHNQFVDFGVRAGVPSLLLFIALIVSIGVVLWRRRGADFDGQLAVCSLFVLAGLCVGSFFQVYFVVTQSAVAIFVLLGLTLRQKEASV